MKLTDIIGPVMVGPSSSHTAGAVRIGRLARRLLGEEPATAELLLHGSFLRTGRGHGTDRALTAGLLGMAVDDPRIPDSLQIAADTGLQVTFGAVDLGEEAHPNSVLLKLTGVHGARREITAASVGGGRIRIDRLDGLSVRFSGDYPTLIIRNQDRPGCVAEVTTLLQRHAVNIADMQLYRDGRGKSAVMILECDEEIPLPVLQQLEQTPGILSVTYLGLEES